ncbi:phage nucleotide-binding protein [Bacteroidales bacterium Barb7]|nr:phage nucleotide-binding protein [Bacteroidales bacterium Barb7]
MTLIKKPNELSTPSTVKVMVYGSAGAGKTTLALSAPKPILFDFDGGVHRVNYAHQTDIIQPSNFAEALQAVSNDIVPYETIVIDTVGKMMDMVILHVYGGRLPKIQDWGTINQAFASFNRLISNMGKNVIYVAHRDTHKDGDDTVFVPALREKSYTAIVTELDLLGYVEMRGNERTITFNPTSRSEGKNTCNLPALMAIPTVVDNKGAGLANTFFQAQIIAPYISNLRERSEQNKAYEALMEELKENIALITDAVSANDFVSRIDAFNHIGNSKAVASTLLARKAAELKLTFNKTSKLYE